MDTQLPITKHTPRPWIADDEHRPNHESYQLHNGKEIIAHGVNAKNMPILRAAPDLLEALEECERYFTKKSAGGKWSKRIHCMIKDAIQKAKAL